MTRVFAGIGIGAVVAITVIEGTARLSGTEGERVLVAGTELSVPVPYTTDAEEAHVGEPGAAKRVVPAKQEEEPPEAARLREHNEELAFENALLRGRLEGTEGVPQPWPEDVPNSFREPGVRAALTEAFGEDATLAVLECEEYPCIALAELDPEAYPDLPGATAAMRTAYETALGIVPEGFFVADVTDEAGNARMIVGTLVLPSDAEPSAELMTRTESRAHTAMDDLLQDGS